ncbi:HIRA-interacting protein 3, partial [Trichinella sp. T6]
LSMLFMISTFLKFILALLLSILMVRSKKTVKSESSRAVCSSTDDETNEDSASEICDVEPSKSTGKLSKKTKPHSIGRSKSKRDNRRTKLSISDSDDNSSDSGKDSASEICDVEPSKSTGKVGKKTKPHSIGGSKSKRDNRRTKLSISDSDDNSSDSGSSDLSPILKKWKQNNSNKKDVESKKKKKLKLYLSDDSEENMSSNLNSNDESDELQNDKKLLAVKNVKQNRVNKADVGLNDETAELSSDSSSLLQNDDDDDDDESVNKQISETEETERKQMSDEKSTSNDSSLSDQSDTSKGKQAESEIEKLKKQEDLENQRDEESDSGSSLPSLNSDSSGDRNKRNKKSDKKSKMKPSESVDELSVLRRCIRVAGLYPNYKSLFVDCNSDREKVDAIKAYFRENGFIGRRITVEACKRFKIRKEEEKEIASLDIKNITASRLRQRKDPNMLFQPSSSTGQSSFQQTPNWKECIKHSDLFTENE